MELQVELDGAAVSSTLFTPHGPVRGGCVVLHPAGDGSRDQPLLRHLAHTLPGHGVAVLLHDRRAPAPGQDVPLPVQARDALSVAEVLRAQVGPVPVGLWGWSQGAWAAALAASWEPRVAFLVLVACAGVTPAAQMRHGTAEQLRRHGFDEAAVDEMLQARRTYERALRGDVDSDEAQRVLSRAATRGWWHLAWLSDSLEPDDRWPDMDFDPVPTFAAASCPTLTVWGEDDPWVPVDVSEAAWRRAAGDRLTVLRLPGVGHGPQPDDERYERGLLKHVLGAVSG